MGCGASAVAHDPVANVAAAVLGAPPAKTTIEPLATPEDVVEFSVVPAEPKQPPSSAQEADVAQADVAPGPQPSENDAVAPAAEASPREGSAAGAPPAAPTGVGGEASAGTIAYHEGDDRLEWGKESWSCEGINELLEHCDSSHVRHLLDECLPPVREDALVFSSAYEELRKREGGPEALEELAHECAAIRQKVLEDRDGDGANASFDRGEGDEEGVDNFWNEPFFLLVSAAKVYSRFSEWVDSIARQANANTTHTACFKPIASAAQKARRPAWQNSGAEHQGEGDAQARGWGSVVDVVRASVVVDDWDGILSTLKAVRGDFDVEILRIRNRFTATSDVPQIWGGYRHIALTVRLLGHGHVCELLVHHRQLYNLRSPESDERFRKFRDALAWSQDGAGGVETFTQLLSPRP
jgi:hypothetical protein